MTNKYGEEQVSADAIIEKMSKDVPADAIAVLALCSEDLWAQNMRFVFGQAHLTNRVGVWSYSRFGEDETLKLQRTLKTAVHETGHQLGILHCKVYKCGMAGR